MCAASAGHRPMLVDNRCSYDHQIEMMCPNDAAERNGTRMGKSGKQERGNALQFCRLRQVDQVLRPIPLCDERRLLLLLLLLG